MRVICIDDHALLGSISNDDGSFTLCAPDPNERLLISLTIGKVYEVLAEEHGMYRIVDDTDDDYLFPIEMFRVIDD
jgi:hypothetical protein